MCGGATPAPGHDAIGSAGAHDQRGLPRWTHCVEWPLQVLLRAPPTGGRSGRITGFRRWTPGCLRPRVSLDRTRAGSAPRSLARPLGFLDRVRSGRGLAGAQMSGGVPGNETTRRPVVGEEEGRPMERRVVTRSEARGFGARRLQRPGEDQAAEARETGPGSCEAPEM